MAAICITACSFAQTFQDVTNNGNYTTKNIWIGGAPLAGVTEQTLNVRGNFQVFNDFQMGSSLTEQFTYSGKSHGTYSMQWATDPSNTTAQTLWLSSYGGMKFFTENTPRFSILSSGNVGIGTTTPDQKLVVNGNVQVPLGGIFGTSLNDAFNYDGKTQPHYGIAWAADSWATGAGPTMWAQKGSGYYNPDGQTLCLSQHTNCLLYKNWRFTSIRTNICLKCLLLLKWRKMV